MGVMGRRYACLWLVWWLAFWFGSWGKSRVMARLEQVNRKNRVSINIREIYHASSAKNIGIWTVESLLHEENLDLGGRRELKLST